MPLAKLKALTPRLDRREPLAMTNYRPDPKILALGSEFYDPVEPADFPKCIPRFVNQPLGRAVGLDFETGAGRRISAASSRCPDNLPQPLALRYHGHQFRVYNPEIGDGRGFTVRAAPRRPTDRLLDLGTKGSGQTPYSRHGRRPPDAQGRRSRSARDRDARGAGRQHVEELRSVRDRGGAGARRRALPDPLGGADPAQPRSHPHRHVPAPRLLRRGRKIEEAGPLLPRKSLR